MHNWTKKQRAIPRKRITLCYFCKAFSASLVSNQPSQVYKRRGINAFSSMGFIVFTCTIRSFDGYIPIHHWSDTAIHRKLQFYHIMYYSIILSAFGTRFGT